jgi:uncharacterized protein
VFPLGPITRDAFGRFIAERFASTSLDITRDAIALLLDITGGHPHDTQKLAYFTWAIAEESGAPATPVTVERALGAAIATDTARYTELWDGLTTNQRRLLEAIGRAAPIDAVLSEDFRRRNRHGAYATVERALDSLVERGLVEREGRARVAVPDVFLRRWPPSPISFSADTAGPSFRMHSQAASLRAEGQLDSHPGPRRSCRRGPSMD